MSASVLSYVPVSELAALIKEYGDAISDRLLKALRESMTKEWAGHFYQTSAYGKREIVIQYTGQGDHQLPDLKRELYYLFGTNPRLYNYVYDDGEPTEPDKEDVLKWCQGLNEKKTSTLHFFTRPITKPDIAQDLWIMKWVAITLEANIDHSKTGYVCQMNVPPGPGIPTDQEVAAHVAARRQQKQEQQNDECTIM